MNTPIIAANEENFTKTAITKTGVTSAQLSGYVISLSMSGVNIATAFGATVRAARPSRLLSLVAAN